VVERGRHARGVEVVPERHALPSQLGGGRLVVEGPEIELEPMVPNLPGPYPGDDLGGGVDGLALVVGVAGDEVEDAMRARAGAVDEVGPGARARGGDARAQGAEAPLLAQPSQVGKLAGRHHELAQARVHAVDADDDDLLADAPGRAFPAAEP